MDARWTLSELVAEVANRIAALPAPKNGQVRALPDERTVRYYGTIGLIDRPGAMRGRTALYGDKHVAQVVAIKRLQAMGRSLSEIQTLWPTLDDATLSRMSGVALSGAKPSVPASARDEFWKRTPTGVSTHTHEEPMPTMPDMFDFPTMMVEPDPPTGPTLPPPHAPPRMPSASYDAGPPVMGVAAVAAADGSDFEVRIALAPNVMLTVDLIDDSVAISPADIRALRAAAAPRVAALKARRLIAHEGE